MAESWVARVADHPRFRFSVKLHRSFTHDQRRMDPAQLGRFQEFVRPLVEAGRLGPLLLQFPWSFRMTPAATDRIKSLVNRIEPFPTAVEVRNGSWGGPDAAAFFCDSAIPLCGIDQPPVGYSLTPDTFFPGKAGAYFRLHGRNRENWFNENAGRDERYDYLYSEKELEVWRNKVREVSEGVERVFVVLNNHFRGQAVANALQLGAMLTGGKSPAPAGVVAKYPQTGKHLKPAPPKPSTGRSDSGDQLFLFENENDEQEADNPGENH